MRVYFVGSGDCKGFRFLRKGGREGGWSNCQTEPRSGPAQDLPSYVSLRGAGRERL